MTLPYSTLPEDIKTQYTFQIKDSYFSGHNQRKRKKDRFGSITDDHMLTDQEFDFNSTTAFCITLVVFAGPTDFLQRPRLNDTPWAFY